MNGPHGGRPKAPESKPGSKPDAKDDLKSLPMPELQATLGSSPDGLSQAEAQKRLAVVLLTTGLSVIIDAIALRAYERHDRRGRREGRPGQT